jgi:hypothetical protein
MEENVKKNFEKDERIFVGGFELTSFQKVQIP